MRKSLYRSALLAVVLMVCLPSLTSAHVRDTLTIVCFGNSTTAPRKGLNKAYPLLLGEKLHIAGVQANIWNAGIPGSHAGSRTENSFHKVLHGLDRFDTAVLAKKPDWVIISFGINDSWQDQGPSSAARIPLEKFKEHLGFFIEKIQAAKGNAILMTPNPLGKKFELYRYKQLKKYRNACLSVAKKHNTEVVDTWKIFRRQTGVEKKGIDGLLMDGMHPNDKGHALMAHAVEQIILQKLSHE